MNAKRIHVVAAAIVDQQQNVLIAQRPLNKHQGGLWEFPGGKLEKDESRWDGLCREIKEEINLDLVGGRPLIGVRHDYADKSVFLDVWLISKWNGVAHGNEGQPVRWVPLSELTQFTFPEANKPILKALSLPDHYFITPEPGDKREFLALIESVLNRGIRLMQLRCKTLSTCDYIDLAKDVLLIANRFGARLMLNSQPSILDEVAAHGVHLASRELMQLQVRPAYKDKLFSASAHNAVEIARATRLDLDFIVLGPVLKTQTHPNAVPIGWESFSQLVDESTIPVYALGGLSLSDLSVSFNSGAQGVASIRAFLP